MNFMFYLYITTINFIVSICEINKKFMKEQFSHVTIFLCGMFLIYVETKNNVLHVIIKDGSLVFISLLIIGFTLS